MGPSPSSNRARDAPRQATDVDPDEASWLDAVDNSFVFVWCDAGIGTQEHPNDYYNTLKNIAGVVNKNRQLVHTFNQIESCKAFIEHMYNICLIISGSFGEQLVPQIHHLPQVRAIYVFCMNKVKHERWAAHYAKIRDVNTRITVICDSLKSHMLSRAALDYDRVEFDVCNHEMNLSENDETDLCLVYAILTKAFLTDMTDAGGDQPKMIKHCRAEYTSECQIQLINDFEQKYREFEPIWWYTKNLFFQGIINRALRARDLYTLCCMQPFIKDLELALAHLYQKLAVSSEPLNLYFGHALALTELERLQSNQGQLICISQFISANAEKAVALLFIEQSKPMTEKPPKVSILFQIRIDRNIEPCVPFGNIGSISEFVHEQEYLLSMFSVFRIGRIEPIAGMSSTWLVPLTLMGKDDLPRLSSQASSPENAAEIRNFAHVGFTVKDRLSLFKSSHKLFKRALRNNRQELRAVMLHHNMAIVHDALGENDHAIDEHRAVLTMVRNSLPDGGQRDDLCLAAVYSNMGLTFQQNKQFRLAFDHAQRALQIVSDANTSLALEKDLKSACYINFGTIHAREGKSREARESYEEALHIRQEYLPAGHPDLTVLEKQIMQLAGKPSGPDWCTL